VGTNKLLLFALLPICAWAVPNANDGKLLYEESCAKCHGISSYQGLGMDEITNLIELAQLDRYLQQAFSPRLEQSRH